MQAVVLDDRVLLLLVDPVIAWNFGIVLVDLSVALLPIKILAARDPNPADEALRGDLGRFGPEIYEIDDRIARVVRNPVAGQSSPLFFFAFTSSSVTSAMTSSFFASFAFSLAFSSASSRSRLELRARSC